MFLRSFCMGLRQGLSASLRLVGPDSVANLRRNGPSGPFTIYSLKVNPDGRLHHPWRASLIGVPKDDLVCLTARYKYSLPNRDALHSA